MTRLIASCADLLPSSERKRKIVILVSRRRRYELTDWLEHFRGDRVLVLGVRLPRRPGLGSQRVSDLDEIYDAIKNFGAVHVLIDLRSEDVAAHRATWDRLLFQLHNGGVFVLRRRRAHRDRVSAELTAWAAQLTSPVPGESAGEIARRDAVDNLVMLDDVVTIRKKGQHFLAVKDDEVEVLLPRRDRSMKVERLLELPEGEYRSRAQVTSHESAVEIGGFPEVITYPQMRLRHYTGPMTFSGRTLVFTPQSILPDSYRFYRARTLDHPVTGYVTADFHTIPRGQRASRDLDGDFYLLDPQWTGHFGHIMTEVVGRLWGWDEAKQRIPDLKALFAVPRGRDADPLLSRVLSAYGIPASDLVAVDQPVRVRSLVAATAMWHNFSPHFVHPDIASVWNRVSLGLADPNAPTYEKIFVSRSGSLWARTCHNAADVERFFEDRGFTIIYPEQLDLSVQAAIFQSARVIAGFGSSAMCNLMHAEKVQHLILLCQEAYTARNEFLYASVLGANTHYFWSTPDVPREPGRYNPKAFTSNWTFDFARNAAPLESLLGEI